MRRPAVFLDRDGVLCENRSTYVKSWSEFQWIPGARSALRALARLGLPVVMVTNQSAINRGLTTTQQVRDLHIKMLRAIAESHGRLDGIYVCPHRPDEGCACRKPGVALFRQAADDLSLDCARSYLIGDSLADLQAGWALGMQVILVRSGLGRETEVRLPAHAPAVRIVADVREAARSIASESVLRPAGRAPAGRRREPWWALRRRKAQQPVETQGGDRR